MEINFDQFLIALRSALHYLYDTNQLLRSPLIELLGLSESLNPASALQKKLIDAIEKIRPGPNEPPQARGWLLHDVLFLRYVRGYERNAIMNQLGLSDRQLSREQKAAIETLAQSIIQAFNLTNIRSGTSEQANVFDPSQPDTLAGTTASSLDNFSWSKNLPVEKFSPWKEILFSVIELLQPLIVKNETVLNHNLDEDLPELRVPVNSLRHSLMNIMGVMLLTAQRGKIDLTASVTGHELKIATAVNLDERFFSNPPLNMPTPASFEVARNLIGGMKGSLQFIACNGRIETVITIPAVEEIPVLVIDDNADIVQLFQRYVLGTRYSITSATEPSDLLGLIKKIHPEIIVLDLMMPEADGWDILTQIHQAGLNYNIAIIVCSILPMESLAYSLGANGFIQKPVLPQDFLRVLDEQMAKLLRENSSGLMS